MSLSVHNDSYWLLTLIPPPNNALLTNMDMWARLCLNFDVRQRQRIEKSENAGNYRETNIGVLGLSHQCSATELLSLDSSHQLTVNIACHTQTSPLSSRAIFGHPALPIRRQSTILLHINSLHNIMHSNKCYFIYTNGLLKHRGTTAVTQDTFVQCWAINKFSTKYYRLYIY